MFAYLRGLIAAAPKEELASSKKGDFAPVELWVEAGGVGYSVMAAPSTAKSAAGQEGLLYLSQSSALYGGETTLYGFLSLEDRGLFELMRAMPGVGAKKSLEYFEKIISKSADRFLDAVVRGDAKTLSGAYGFSAKTAAKMTAELREKAGQLTGAMAKAPASRAARQTHADSGVWVDGNVWERARSALVGLGFGAADSEAVLNEVAAKVRSGAGKQAPTLEHLVKEALKELSLARS